MAQAPTDNPYRTRYLPNTVHWTDSLKWTTVTDAAAASGVLDANNNVDSTALANLMQQVSNSGGGVIFFPAGTYKFNKDLKIPSRVVLRGVTPSVANATDSAYSLATKFEFPKYEFDSTAAPDTVRVQMGNNSVLALRDISKDFKKVYFAQSAFNAGLVNIDINRALIEAYPYNWNASFTQPLDMPYNIIIFGCKSNNATKPDPNCPTPQMILAGKHWQRYNWRFASNIAVLVARNALIANNRINDNPTDIHVYPVYYTDFSTGTNNACVTGVLETINGQSLRRYSGGLVRFNPTYQGAISVNRKKINNARSGSGSGPNAPYAIQGNVTYANPTNEPTLFAPGNEILDNWAFYNNRVGIIASGNGLTIRGNVTRMQDNTVEYVELRGIRCQSNNSATYEKRGIDFSGWNIRAEYNDIEVYRGNIGVGGHPTVDGEGILVQECCGGTSVKDYVIKHNTLKGDNSYIGLWKMRDLLNVFVDSNVLGCRSIIMTANTNGATYSVHNMSIKGNTKVKDIQVDGSVGGSNVVIDSNAFCNNITITAPGYATIGGNNTGPGSLSITVRPGGPITPPTAKIVVPSKDTTVISNTSITFNLTYTDADSVRFYVGTTPITSWMSVSAAANYTWVAPAGAGNYYFSAYAKTAGVIPIWSNTIKITVTPFFVNPTTGQPSSIRATPKAVQNLNVYPNPNDGLMNFVLTQSNHANVNLTIFNAAGKQVFAKNYGNTLAVNQEINLRHLPKGVYIARVQTGETVSTQKIIIQ
jgi:hypothetical protein